MNKFFWASSFSVLLILSFLSLSFAQEDLTITTYYPSPNGVYENMTVTKALAVGSTARAYINGIAAVPDGVVVASGPHAGYYFGGRNGDNDFAMYSSDGSRIQLWDKERSDDIIQFSRQGPSNVNIYGNTVVFRNRPAGTPASIRVKEVLFCSSY